jgi:hypothetical protein
LKEEEKLAQNQGQRGIGKSQRRGKAVSQDRVQKPKDEEKNLIITQKGEEVHKEDNIPIRTLFREQEEEEEVEEVK